MQDRRWMFALVTGLLLAGAARSVLAQNETKGTPAKEVGKEPGKEPAKEPAKEATAPKTKEKTYLFEMRNKPWSGVIEWLVDTTGLPFISDNQAPSGTVTLIVPRTGLKPKELTMSEIFDLVNENLIAKKFVLIRRPAALTLVAADEKIPVELVPRITMDELPKFGNSEIVQVVYPLKSLIAEEIAPEAKKLMGNFSEVVVLARANQLVLQDNVGTLRRLVKMLEDIEKGEEGAETYTHKCIFVRARDAEAVLRNILGNPNDTVVTAVQQPGSQPMGPGGRDGRDSRDPGGFPFGGFNRPSTPLLKERSRKYTIATDERTNTVYVNGPADKIALAKSVLTKLDVGTEKLIIGQPSLQTYQIPQGNAVELAKTLLEIHKGASNLRIQAVGNTQLYVYAGPEEQIEIARQLQGVRPPAGSTEKIPIAALEAVNVAKMLSAMFGDPKTGAPFIDSDAGSNSVIVKGSTEQVSEVKLAIKAITSDAAIEGNVRIISLEKGSAVTLADAIQRLLKDMRPGTDVKVISPGSKPDPEPAPPERKSILKEPREQEISFQEQPLPKQEEKKTPAKKGAPITITAFGNKLIVTSDDPQALTLVQELVRLITRTDAGEGDFEYIRLKNANATDAAKILDEAFNGPKQGGGRPQGPGGFGGGGFPFAAPNINFSLMGGAGGAREERIRVVADTGTNALLVRAKPLDMLTVRKLLTTAIDSGESDSSQLIRTFPISPSNYVVKKGEIYRKDGDALTFIKKAASHDNDGDSFSLMKNAAAADVALVVRDVYRESMNNNSRFGGGGGFSPFGGGGGTNQRMNIDPNGNPRGVMLSVGVDDKTNSLILACPKTLFEDIFDLVRQLEIAAGDSKQIVRVLKVNIDPMLLEQAMDTIQGRASTTNRTGGGFGTGGFGTGSGFRGPGGGGGFGGTGFGGAGFGGGGAPFGGGGFGGGMPFGGGAGFGGGTFSPTGGRGFGTGGGGGRTGFGGGRGGGGRSSLLAPDPRGPDFFALAVKDDHQESVLFDPLSGDQPADATGDLIPAGVPLAPVSASPSPIQTVAFQGLPGKDGLPQGKDKAESVTAPRRPVIVEALPELGSVVIRADNIADLEATLRIIEFIQRIGSGADIEFITVPLKHADATSVVNTLNVLFGRVQIGVNSTTQTGGPRPGQPQQQQPFAPGFGQQQQQTQQASAAPGSVVLIPMPRQNSILVATAKARTKDVLREIERLDVPMGADGKAVPFALKRAPAWRVATQIQTFYADRFPGEGRAQNQIRVTYDDYANLVFVQAGPTDMAEIRALIDLIDNTVSSARNDLRVIPLRNAVAVDLSTLITSAIADGFVPTTTGAGGQLGAQPGGLPGGGLPGGGLPGGGLPGQGGQLGGQLGQIRQTKVSSLSFLSNQTKDGKPIETGILDDIRITPDARTNALVVAAPEKTMQLIYALIRELDIVPAARATINIFHLKKADAAQLAQSLQQLFTGTGGAAQRPQAGVPGQPAGGLPLGQAGAATTTQRPLITLGSAIPEGAPIIDLRITVDDRTNSLIVAGSPNDLDIIAGVIAKLDDARLPERRQETYRLRNAYAADIASALNAYYTKIKTVLTESTLLTPYQSYQREVVIEPDPITNSLIISATPQYFDEVMKLVSQLDAALPQVAVQVLIAEVDLTDANEFGVEIGLQTPVLFRRAFNTGGSSFIPAGVSTSSTFNPAAFPGQNSATTLGTNIIDQGIVGYQALGSLGVGRISPTQNIGGFVFSAANESVNLLVRALRVQGRIDVLSRPQLVTLDGQTAKCNFGLNFPIVTTANVTGTGIVTQNIDRTDVGIKLEITPKIMLDGRVVMRVIPEVSSVVPQPVNLGNGQLSTALNKQQLETTVSAYDGETIALGGFISTKDSKTENKLPWLGDLPYVGALFRYRTQSKAKTELLIILTPHVVYGKAEAERLLAEEARRMDWVLGDVAKVHGPGFLDAAAGCLPPTTIIDGTTPILEQGPAPRMMMPPASMQTPNVLPPTVSRAPAPLAPPVNAAPLPLTAPNTLAVAPPAPAPDAPFSQRVQVLKASDLVPPAPAAPVTAPAVPQAAPPPPPAAERNPQIYLPTYPNPQPVGPTPSAREVPR